MKSTRQGLRFSNKVEHYAHHATAQQRALEELSALLSKHNPTPQGHWVDFGAGPPNLHRPYFSHQSIEPILFDLSYLHTTTPHQSSLCGALEELPIRKNSLDGAISSSALQWTQSPIDTLTAIVNTVKKKGLIAIAALTQGTLSELQQTQRAIGITPPTTYPNQSALSQLTQRMPVALLEKKSILLTDTFSTAMESLKSLSAIGATHHNSPALSPQQVKRFLTLYAQQFEGQILHQYHFEILILRKTT